MSAKRSRIVHSSSYGDTGLLPPRSADSSDSRLHVRTAFGNGAKALKPSPEAVQSPPSVLTMSSPEIVTMGREAQIDKFLDHCYFCRRRLPHNEDVFMCGPFRAFCSPECRDQQVDLDKIAEQPKQVPVQPVRTMYSMTNNVNGSKATS